MEIHEIQAWFHLVADMGATICFAVVTFLARRELRRGRYRQVKYHKEVKSILAPIHKGVREIHAQVIPGKKDGLSPA